MVYFRQIRENWAVIAAIGTLTILLVAVVAAWEYAELNDPESLAAFEELKKELAMIKPLDAVVLNDGFKQSEGNVSVHLSYARNKHDHQVATHLDSQFVQRGWHFEKGDDLKWPDDVDTITRHYRKGKFEGSLECYSSSKPGCTVSLRWRE